MEVGQSLGGAGAHSSPKAAREQATLGLRVDRGEAITFPDGRPGNRFHLQPNAQAKQESIKKLISSKSTHYNIISFDILEGADEEKVKHCRKKDQGRGLDMDFFVIGFIEFMQVSSCYIFL